jgi:protein-arginine kinase activator protein McsA
MAGVGTCRGCGKSDVEIADARRRLCESCRRRSAEELDDMIGEVNAERLAQGKLPLELRRGAR